MEVDHESNKATSRVQLVHWQRTARPSEPPYHTSEGIASSRDVSAQVLQVLHVRVIGTSKRSGYGGGGTTRQMQLQVRR